MINSHIKKMQPWICSQCECGFLVAHGIHPANLHHRFDGLVQDWSLLQSCTKPSWICWIAAKENQCSFTLISTDNTVSCMAIRLISHWWITHWGRVMHICVGNLTTGSDNGLVPGRHQTIISINAGIFLIRPLGRNFSEILFKIHTFSFKKMHFKTSAKGRPFCLALNVLTVIHSAFHVRWLSVNATEPY